MSFQQSLRADAPIPIAQYATRRGDHMCSVWTDPVVDRLAANEFLKGASDGERALWIHDVAQGEAPAFSDGLLLTTDDVHVEGGLFDPERMRSFWRNRSAEAAAVGTQHVRAVAEMAWALRKLPGTEATPLFESSLNELLGQLSIAVLCQYGSSRFDAEIVLAMILSHPVVVIGTSVYSNPFYVEHDEFPRRFESLRADPTAALLPTWTHFLGQLSGLEEIARFVCTSLPGLVGAEEIWVSFDESEEPVTIDITRDRIEPGQLSALSGVEGSLRLYAVWPKSGSIAGGSMSIGTPGKPGAMQVRFDGRGFVLAMRRDPFIAAQATTFATLANRLSTVLAPTAGLASPARRS